MRSHARRASTLLAVALLATGCAPILSNPADFATDSGGNGSGPQTSTVAPDGPPEIAAVVKDLSWRDCASDVADTAGVQLPAGVRLECANVRGRLDPVGGGAGRLQLGVVRASSADTPADAGPVVFTTGSDIPSSVQLPVWLSRSGTDILKQHPVVAIDRRGTGRSDAIECREPADRREMRDQAQFEPGDDQVANLGAATQTATVSCTDFIIDNAAYTNARSAEDLETLRTAWEVPTLALIGVGNGAQVALAYAGTHPDKVSRLLLDSPLPLSISAETAAGQALAGQQHALDAFAAQCAAMGCSLGPDPKAVVSSLISDARADRGPGGLSAAAVVAGITDALAYPIGDGAANTSRLSDILDAARSGDAAGLQELVDTAYARTGSDGAFVNRCSDALNRPTPDRARELLVAWGKQYPQFGAVAALKLVECLNWPSGSPPKEPTELGVNVLMMGVGNNPISGSDGVAATQASIINAGATSRRVIWQGVGNGASIYTECAMPALLGYLADATLPDTDTFCPA
ncbi:alpha/beta hydrolase [Mycolicibacterium brumae]|uniref:Alpha/beta hydrolase n=1 Tax=Mycolicibacterium brumae TaxID=85968 RepID=A0A2G5PDX9_9MYCO|nr:alpha/beta fold hydrolase [Mycolicibacterium brumae]MCV7193537.1 alpha/beta hydrolase [Mycolicibacterium brumae]PIB76114.1 alpha/beta hydrolase [Mycolicibacterium brumae]RWA17235.1 hypothetical protein MBRU_06315 [Mycolicibacterium brumae DSM 44177]UWW09191.1 alpha/beta hydrolase [Mycolicibacterium brumae]